MASARAARACRERARRSGRQRLRFNPRAKLGVAYTGELAPSQQSHAVKGSFTWNF